jgi:hypothetical protein
VKRFLVFAGNSFYALGGALDFQDHCDTLEEAMTAATALKRTFDWFHILDGETRKIVAFAEGSYCGSARNFDYDPDFDRQPPPDVTWKQATEYWPDAEGKLQPVARKPPFT